jgi:hypothetical protein
VVWAGGIFKRKMNINEWERMCEKVMIFCRWRERALWLLYHINTFDYMSRCRKNGIWRHTCILYLEYLTSQLQCLFGYHRWCKNNFFLLSLTVNFKFRLLRDNNYKQCFSSLDFGSPLRFFLTVFILKLSICKYNAHWQPPCHNLKINCCQLIFEPSLIISIKLVPRGHTSYGEDLLKWTGHTLYVYEHF